MLPSDQIEALRLRAGEITSPIVDFLVADIAERISEAGQLTSTAAYQVWKLQKLGVSQQEMKKQLRKLLKVSNGQIEQLLTQAAEVGYDFDISRFPHAEAVAFAQNDSLQQLVSAAVEQAQADFSNLTQTMGFVTYDGKPTELTEAYRKSCDFAFEKIFTGAQDYASAIRDATRGLAEKGILSLDYESGRHRSVEAAVRANMMGGINTMSREVSQRNHDMLGCDGWEISAHSGSAPDHEPFQGKQYSDAEFAGIQSILVRDFETFGCGHKAMGIILGINEPQYTAEELEEMRRENEQGITYEGKHYTLYEAGQRQRRIETAMRNQKRKILIDEKTGDQEKLQWDQIRLVTQRDEYSRFSKAAGLRMQHERAEVAGFTWKHGKAAEAEWVKAEASHREWLKSIGADNTEFSNLAFYKKARYNKNTDYRLLRQYAKDVESGWISPLSGFDNYRGLYGRVQTEIVGKTAANGTVITGQVPHFMQRVIGTMADPEKLKRDLKIIRRSGVEIEDIKNAIFAPENIGKIQTRVSGQRSVKLYGKKCIVTINPDTGELIQTNPL